MPGTQGRRTGASARSLDAPNGCGACGCPQPTLCPAEKGRGACRGNGGVGGARSAGVMSAQAGTQCTEQQGVAVNGALHWRMRQSILCRAVTWAPACAGVTFAGRGTTDNAVSCPPISRWVAASWPPPCWGLGRSMLGTCWPARSRRRVNPNRLYPPRLRGVAQCACLGSRGGAAREASHGANGGPPRNVLRKRTPWG